VDTRAFWICLIAAILAGCVTDEPSEHERYSAFSPSTEEARQIEAHVQKSLKISDALFAGLRTVSSSSGIIYVCGWVRARSDAYDYARYPNNRPFAARFTLGGDKIQHFRLIHFAGVKIEASAVYIYCAQRGMPL